MRPVYDVAIAGLGAMGGAAAWRLAGRRRRVIAFDRYRPPHALGSSTGRSRIIREAYFEGPGYVPLVRRAFELWGDLERRTGRQLLRPTTGLTIGPPTGRLVAGVMASAEAHGIPHEALTAAEVRRRFPFRPADDLTAVLESRAGVLGPEDCLSAMLGEAAQAGADLRFDEPVLGWTAGRDAVTVQTAGQVIEAGRLILATGPWMGAGLANLALPLQVTRQVAYWVRPRQAGDGFGLERCPVWLWETPEGSTYYGFPDLGEGPKVARHHGGEPVHPDRVRREVGPEEAADVLAFLAHAIPDLHGAVTDARVCLYTNTPDGHFLLDRHPAAPAVLLASPCSGHGFKFAPVIGEILADLAADQTPPFDLAPFRLGRFSEGVS